MRFISSVVFLSMLSLTTLALAATEKPVSSCVQKCEAAKKSCMAQYTMSDSTHGTYVTPDGHKVCWQGFHECKKQCPQGSK
jgi:hypothetical protein